MVQHPFSIAASMTSPDQRRIGKTKLAVDILGFGCAPLGNLYRAISDDDAAALLHTAWQEGFRYFDTAPHYGQGLSERRLGDALRDRRGEAYVLSTKAGRLLKPAGYALERHGFVSPMPFDIVYDYGYDGILRSFDDSLQRLGLDRIDILYLHDIGRVTHGADNERLFPIAMDGGYRALDELRRAWPRYGHRPRRQRMGGLRSGARSRGLGLLSARRPLHAARAGSTRLVPAEVH